MNPFRVIASLLWANPLLRQRWRWSTAYTWENLILACMVCIALLTAGVRALALHEAQVLMETIPPELRHRDLDYLLPDLTPARLDPDEWVRVGDLAIGMAEILVVPLFLCAWILVYAFAAIRIIPAYRYSRRWDRLDNSDIASLPLSPLQVIIARHDWPILKCILILVAMPLLLLLLPSRDYLALLIYEVTDWAPTFHPEFLLVVCGFTLATGVYLSFRHAQMTSQFGLRHGRLGFVVSAIALICVDSFVFQTLYYWILRGTDPFELSGVHGGAVFVGVLVVGALGLTYVFGRRLLRQLPRRGLRFDAWSMLWLALIVVHLQMFVDFLMPREGAEPHELTLILVTFLLSNLAAWRAIAIAPAILADPESFDAAPRKQTPKCDPKESEEAPESEPQYAGSATGH